MSQDTAALEITHENFTEYFRDVKKSSPQPGEVMARFRATAELCGEGDKEIVVDLLLTNPIGADMAVKVLRNRCDATDEESVKLAKAICQDLADGKPREDVIAMPHKFVMEKFFYTQKEYVPQDDKHWDVIKILNAKEFANDSSINSGHGGEQHRPAEDGPCVDGPLRVATATD